MRKKLSSYMTSRYIPFCNGTTTIETAFLKGATRLSVKKLVETNIK